MTKTPTRYRAIGDLKCVCIYLGPEEKNKTEQCCKIAVRRVLPGIENTTGNVELFLQLSLSAAIFPGFCSEKHPDSVRTGRERER